ncbi:MAG TPA: dihydrofolate reductase family protein [Pseudonocardia sp.]|uniref:dihydrofolate reductase family protein n=1 Tax=Pseudonocardia sp. TaxID=60912 RepID=UPI002F404324
MDADRGAQVGPERRLGRRSHEFFAARWPARRSDLADRLNSLPNYVVSSTLEDPDWNNSTVLKGDMVNEVSKLKQELDGDIVVYASLLLGSTLIEHDLVDELRLMVYPVVLGAGERLFRETSDKKPMRLVSTRAVGDGIAFLTYEPIRDAWYSRACSRARTSVRGPFGPASGSSPSAERARLCSPWVPPPGVRRPGCRHSQRRPSPELLRSLAGATRLTGPAVPGA